MMKPLTRTSFVALSLAVALMACGPTAQPATMLPAPTFTPTPVLISEFGKYQGYSEPIYEAWIRTSQYVTMRDSVRLAVDIIRPAQNGEPVAEPLPVVWTHHRYHRARFDGNRVVSMVDDMPALQRLVRHGYVIAVVDVRGSGASFGRYEGFLSEAETRDAYEMTEWLAAQSWSSGQVGMFGGSYLGFTQYMAASQKPPHLKALFPIFAGFDLYNMIYPGGIYRQDVIEHWGSLTRQLDLNIERPLPPVDEDLNGALLAQAVAMHQANDDVRVEFPKTTYRSDEPDNLFNQNNPAHFLDAINQSSIPMYHWAGWFDGFTLDALQWYANLIVPQKLAVGPWEHNPAGRRAAEWAELLEIEQLRWFDYWLKGIENGIMDEPPIHYATMRDSDSWAWQAAESLPFAETAPTRYFLTTGPSGSVPSVNAGLLTLAAPTHEAVFDTYQPDLTTTSGRATRWDNLVGIPMVYPDLAQNDARGLTYTSLPLVHDITVTGSPIVTLYVTLTTSDGDFYTYLEEIDDEGHSHYVTEGWLRASHRALAEPPYDNLGLPYHSHDAEANQAIGTEGPVELVFYLLPTSTIFDGGNRIRLTLTGADSDNMEVLETLSAPTVQLYHDRANPSSLWLPVTLP